MVNMYRLKFCIIRNVDACFGTGAADLTRRNFFGPGRLELMSFEFDLD